MDLRSVSTPHTPHLPYSIVLKFCLRTFKASLDSTLFSSRLPLDCCESFLLFPWLLSLPVKSILKMLPILRKKERTFITQSTYRILIASSCLENIAQIIITHIHDCQDLAQWSHPVSSPAFCILPMQSPLPQTSFLFFCTQQVLIRKIINSSMKSFQATQPKYIFCASIFHGIYYTNATVKALCYNVIGGYICLSSK